MARTRRKASRRTGICAAIFVCGSIWASAQSRELDSRARSAEFLVPFLVPGQEIDQVFSRTISTSAEGLDPVVRRTSGTGMYRTLAISNDSYTFDSSFLYDGHPSARITTKIKRDGTESCWESACASATDASGLLFNSLLWGVAPKRIAVGSTWRNKIAAPWELGPPGEQDVTVAALDIAAGTITLLRIGRGEGPFADDPGKITLTKDGKEYSMDAKSGAAKWSGYTTVTRGIIVSDELLVERSLTLYSKELGTLRATQRQYILLNKMPHTEPVATG